MLKSFIPLIIMVNVRAMEDKMEELGSLTRKQQKNIET